MYMGGSYGGALHDQDFRPTMRYYTRDRFPFPQGNAGPYEVNPGMPGLDNPPFPAFPVAQPGAICAAGSGKMNFYRPNQALVRGVVRGGMGGPGYAMPILPVIVAVGATIFLFGSNLLAGRRK